LAAAGLGAGALAASARPARAGGATRYEKRLLADTAYETTLYVYDSGVSGPTTMVVGGMHGDERSGYLAAGDIAGWRVETGRLVVLPRANRPAIANGTRTWNGDLNRHFPPTGGACESKLARAIWETVVQYDPDWVFDLHSSRGIYASGDGGVGQAMFPTWTAPAREYGSRAVDGLNDVFDLAGEAAYRMGNTLDADRPMLMHRVAGVLDRPGFICETSEKYSLAGQVRWHKFAVRHVMRQYGQERGPPASGGLASSFEADTVAVNGRWRSFGAENDYDAPVLVAPALSLAGNDPAHVRLSNVRSNGFRARAEEWQYLDRAHTREWAGYLLFDAGAYASDDGDRRLQAGRRRVDHDWRHVSLGSGFRKRPVVLATPQTVAGSQPVVARVRNVTDDGFGVRLQEEEGGHRAHVRERVGWLAVDRGRGRLAGRRYEAGRTKADHLWTEIEFSRSYTDPVFVAGTMSFAGSDPIGLRYRHLSSRGVDVKVEEEESDDDEREHARETVGYVVVEGGT
jgi:hypothetical protein